MIQMYIKGMGTNLIKTVTTVEDYLAYLSSKGFQFGEDSIGFIMFGQHYTSASDELVNVAIELTLKAQKQFDGSFFISILEMCKGHEVFTREQALQLAKVKQII